MNKERNYGIDLLRLVLMYMVCMQHTLFHGGILKNCADGSASYYIIRFLYIISRCAVDGFAFISGYMTNDKPRKYEKLIEMWFQVLFYSFIVTLIFTIIGLNKAWSKMDILKSILPVAFDHYWYFTAFFILYLAMPLLNRFLFTVDVSTAKKSFIIMAPVFSAMEVLGDPLRVGSGYDALWIIMVYCIGVLAKRIKLFETRRSITLIALWALCMFATWGVYIWSDSELLVKYVSPTILLSAIIMVILFSRIKIKGTLVKKISPLAFGIYLFHVNPIIWNRFLHNAFIDVAKQPALICIALAFAIAFAIFASGLLVEYIRSRLSNLLRIPALSRKIAVLIDKTLCKLFPFLN